MARSLSAFGLAFDPRRLGYDAVLFLLGPILLVMFPALPFLNNGSCDPWYAYGLYFHLPDALRWAVEFRQVGRLTGTLPGYWFIHIFPAIYAERALFLLFFTPAVMFVYKSAAVLCSRSRAAVAAVFFACSPLVVGNYSITYTAPSLTYEILAFYCAVRALHSQGHKRLGGWMFLSGVAWAAALHAHLAVLPFSGFIYLFFAVTLLLEFDRALQARVATIAMGFVMALFGAAALTGALAVFAAVTWGQQYGSIVFNQFYAIKTVSMTSFWNPDWYRSSPTVGMSLLGFAAAATMIANQWRSLIRDGRSTASGRLELAIGISFVLTLAVLVGNELLHGVFLEYEYYYVLLWPFLTLVVFAIGNDSDFPGRYALLFAFAIICIVFISIKQELLPQWAKDYQAALSGVIAIAAAALLLGRRHAAHGALLGGYLLLLALSILIVRPHHMGVQLWTEANDRDRQRSYERLNVGLKYLNSVFTESDLDRPNFWPDDDSVFDAIFYNRAYGWCGYHNFPHLDSERWNEGFDFKANDTLVIIARPPNLFDRVKTLLAGVALEPTELSSKMMVDEVGPYQILVVRLRKLPSSSEVPSLFREDSGVR